VNELKVYEKPQVTLMEERAKELYMNAIQQVTSLIGENEAEKVVIARALKLSFDREHTSSTVLHHVTLEQHLAILPLLTD